MDIHWWTLGGGHGGHGGHLVVDTWWWTWWTLGGGHGGHLVDT